MPQATGTGATRMKKFIRDNPTIAFRARPAAAARRGIPRHIGIPALLVAPPQYEVLYATHYNFHNNAHNAIQIAVVGDRVQVSYVGNTQPYQTPRLWRFDPKPAR